ncbi:TolC family outer membrane protein [Jannaschia seohaensis]|uniref:Outer membrane protein n=1 Tax=Jannaschia seohaensis TaxID=475081 RepID=A0A2Y9C767_9RHOB|nr:TolC family outer membrane protein [Jannaschia seohaensis]PWJ20443.1 outer membrane protein [Jannaschia seohaensis]SSA44533.1 outer membrane protein [Jannaschia seohaensis]
MQAWNRPKRRKAKLLRAWMAGVALSALTATSVWAESLADAFVQTYRTSPLLEQQRLLLRTLDEDVAVATAALRPAINGQVNLSRTLNGGSAPNVTSSSLSLILDYTLLDGGQRLFRLGAAKEAVLAGRYRLIQQEQQLLLQAAQAYLNLLQATRNVDLRESNLRLLNEQLRAAEDRFEVGEVTRTDVTIAEARLAAAQSLLANARGQVDIQRETYRLITGAFPSGSLDQPPASPELPPSLAQAKAIALQIHPLITAAQHDVTAADLIANAAEADRLPSIAFRGTLGTSRNIGGDPSLSASITGSVPIYNGGRLSALNRRAIANAQAARSALTADARTVTDGVGQAWALLQIARAQITASQQQVRSAQLAFEGFREEALLGARTTLDVLDAEQELLDARTSALQAEIDAQLAVYQVLAAMGLMTTDHLGLSVERYDPSAYYNQVSTAPAISPSPQGGRLDSVLRRFGRE